MNINRIKKKEKIKKKKKNNNNEIKNIIIEEINIKNITENKKARVLKKVTMKR